MELADMNISLSVEILSSYSNVDEDSSLLAYGTLSTGTQLLMFHRSLLPLSSGYVVQEDGRTGRLGKCGSVIVIVMLSSRRGKMGQVSGV